MVDQLTTLSTEDSLLRRNMIHRLVTGYRYHEIRKAFSTRLQISLISKRIFYKVTDIIKFEKHFLNSTTDTQSQLLNTTLG